jgi:ketosteroid isomerase-like protein
MTMTNSDFEAFFKRRTQAAEAYTNGDFAPLAELIAETGAASFHSPQGDTEAHAQKVAARYRKDAAGFKAGGESRFEILQKASSKELGFWTGFQVAKVSPASEAEPIDIRIRVTEIFRKIEGEWKMIHRHADIAGKDRSD